MAIGVCDRQAGVVTRREWLSWCEEHLTEQGVPKARVEAEWLLAHVLGCSRTVVLSEGSLALAAIEERQLRDLAELRGERIPLQHLLGTTIFYGLKLAVNGRVLVPRPETEQLAELALEFAMGLRRTNMEAWRQDSLRP